MELRQRELEGEHKLAAESVHTYYTKIANLESNL